MKKISFLLFVMIILCSCTFPINGFEPGKEGISLNKFLLKKSHYECLGSYISDTSTVVSTFNIDSKYSLTIYKLGILHGNIPISHVANDNFPRLSGLSSEINDTFFNIKFYYNDYDKPINDIKLYSDGDIKKGISNDSIIEYDTGFKNFTALINNGSGNSLVGESLGKKIINSNFVFYKKEGYAYFLIMAPLNVEEKIKENTLSKYILDKE